MHMSVNVFTAALIKLLWFDVHNILVFQINTLIKD